MKSNRSRLLFVVVSLCALASLRAVAGPEGSGRDPATRALSIFSEVFSLTRSNYVEPTDTKALLEGAYDGMSDALDPFSYYVPSPRWPRTRRSRPRARPARASSSRAAEAIPYVVGAAAGLPGREGRRQAGRPDRLDRRPAAAQRPVWKIKAALEGPEGSSCELVLFRGGDEKRVTLPVAARRFERAAPVSAKWERDVAIIKIPTFTPATAAAVRKELDEASRRSIDSRDPRPARLDRRGDPDAAPVASLFVGEGPDRDGASRARRRRSRSRPPGDRCGTAGWSSSMDDSTAGAAEVFAAALHDRAKATTVGETTVGMAIIQRACRRDEGGNLYMTVGRYVSPSGQVLGGKGLSPDERVLVIPGRGRGPRPILERGLEIARGADAAAGRLTAGARRRLVSPPAAGVSPATVFFALLSLVLAVVLY